MLPQRSLLGLALSVAAIFTSVLGLPVVDGALAKRAPSGAVFASNFPDPGLVKIGSTWYSFATRTIGSSIHYQISKSTDFVNWAIVTNADGTQKDAMPVLPAWVNQKNWNTWAPDVVQIAPNNFVMWFTASAGTGTAHCIGYATATNIEGPYVGNPTSSICPLSQGGAIDPGLYRGPAGQRYVVYKIDGNSLGHGGACGNSVAPIVSTAIMLQRLNADGITMSGAPIKLLDNAGASDDGIIEAPALAQAPNGVFFLFFSSGCFVDNTYTVSYATAPQPWGPWTRQASPLLKSGDYGLVGPGGADVSSDGHNLVFHAFNGPTSNFVRSLHTATLSYSGNTASVN